MDDIISSVDESIVLPPAITEPTGKPLTWTEVASLILALDPKVRDLPALLTVDPVPKTTAYVLTFISARGVGRTDALPI